MNHIGENLKYLRKTRGMTQQTLAEALYLKRPVIGAYEEGRAEPKLETLKKISDLFSVPIESLMGVSLMEENEKNKGSIVSEPEKTIEKLKILSITVNSENEENIEWVPIKASAGYLNGYADPEFMTRLPKFQLPMLKGGTLRAFEIKGESMLPIVGGTFIIGEYVEDIKWIKDGTTYIVVSKSEGIVYKRLYRLENENKINLVSDNIEFEPYTLDKEDVLELWKAKAFISSQFPEPENKNSIEKLGEMLVELQKSMDNLKK